MNNSWICKDCIVLWVIKYMIAILTLSVPSLLVPTPDTKGGGRPDPSAISKTLSPMNLKFCRILEAFLNVLEI